MDLNERIEFYFPARLARMLREAVPMRERSRFVAEATERELKRRLFHKRLTEFAAIKKDTYGTAKAPGWKKPKALAK